MADPNPKLKLYSYWRSSCSFRVRIALKLKGLNYEYKAVNLLNGEQSSPEFKDLNPLGYVPVLVDDDVVLADSFAILMYLEEKYPGRPLLPRDLKKRAINYQVANIVSSNIQPLQNLTILKLIEEKINPDEKVQWGKYHIEKGFQVSLGLKYGQYTGLPMPTVKQAPHNTIRILLPLKALEKLLNGYAGTYATGDEVGLADVFLAPQLDAAFRRFNVNKDEFPILKRLHDAYFELPEFLNALPEQQPDAPQTCIVDHQVK